MMDSNNKITEDEISKIKAIKDDNNISHEHMFDKSCNDSVNKMNTDNNNNNNDTIINKNVDLESNKKINTKVVFKNKTDRPNVNPFSYLCDFFLTNKTRFCKFDKMEGFNYCKYHNEGVLVKCNLCEHKILERKIDMHKKVCKAIKLEETLNNSYWYKKNINLLRQVDTSNPITKPTSKNTNLDDIVIENYKEGQNLLTTNKDENELSDYVNKKIENDLNNDNNDLLTTENLKQFLPKLVKCYYSLRNQYFNYVLKNFDVDKKNEAYETLNDIEKNKNSENLNSKDLNLKEEDLIINESKSFFGSVDLFESDDGTDYMIKGFRLSGVSIDIKKDLDQTLKVKHLEKHSSQGEALVNVMKTFGLLDKNENFKNEISSSDSLIKTLFIEFGAGKGGLTEKIVLEKQKENEKNNENSENENNDYNYYLLLERDGIRYKKDKINKNIFRIRTDILDYDINSSNRVINEIDIKNNTINKEKNIHINAIGVAKHICGCALDMSATCLSRLNNNTTSEVIFKGLCFATCCHQRSHLNHFLGYEIIKEMFSFSDLDFKLLFKCTSWTFESKNGDMSEKYKKVLKNQLEKKKIGLMCKYTVDLGRCLYLIDKGMKVLYLKYISNHITTENNVILCTNN